MTYFSNLLWTILSVVLGLKDHQMFRGCFSSEKVTTLETILIRNVLRMKPYLPCPCGRNPECEVCGGSGDAPGLNSRGQLYGPRLAKDGSIVQDGTMVRLSRYTGRGAEKLTAKISGGLVNFLSKPKQIPCFCKGNNKSCHFCSGGGMTYDRWLVQVPRLVGNESTALTVACLLQIRKLAEQKIGFNYIMIVQKGGGVILATLDAFREIDPNLEEGKLIKRFGYYVGNFMWKNTSMPTTLKMLALKDEAKWNGLTLANIEITLNKVAYEGVAIRDYNGKVLKGTVRGIDKAELLMSLRLLQNKYGYAGVEALDVDAICTEEMIKVAPKVLIADTEKYSVFEVNIADWLAVAPPVSKGRPSIGLTIWKYGIEGLKLAKLIINNLSTLKSGKMLSKALGGHYESECRILNVSMPDPEDDNQISGFNMPILRVNGDKYEWANPKDEVSLKKMFDRFLSFYRQNILRVETQGAKEILISSSILMEDFQDLAFKYHEEQGLERALYAVVPDQEVFTDNGVISMLDALSNPKMGFIMKKDPAGSILQFLPITPITVAQWTHYIEHGEFIPAEEGDEEFVLCKRGAILVSSIFRWMMCLPDLDGDKCALIYIDRTMMPSCPPVTDWDTMWADNIKTEKPNLTNDWEVQCYVTNMMINVVCARGAIGPIVRGGVAAAVERTAYGILTGNIRKMTADMWLYLQQLWIGISEIMGIKKEKTLADAKQRFTSFVDVVDMVRKFYEEGYTISKGSKMPDPEMDEQAASAQYMREVYMSLVSPKGEEYMEDEETGELELVSTMEPRSVLETLIVKAQDIDEIFPKAFREFFPLTDLVRRFKSTKIQDIEEQQVASVAGIPEEDRLYYSLTSDSQKQNWVFHRALQFFILDHPRAQMVIDRYRTAANLFVKANRQAIKLVYDEFGTERSLEKLNFKRSLMEQVISIPIQLGFVHRHPEKPWTYGEVVMKNNATLFALLVGIADTQYISEGYDGYRQLRDGQRTSFNKCPKSDVINVYLAAYANSPIDDFDGSGRTEKVNTLKGFKFPYWVTESVLPDYSAYDAPEWTDEEEIEM